MWTFFEGTTVQKCHAHNSDTQKIFFVTPVFTGAQGKCVLIRLVLHFCAAKQTEGSQELLHHTPLIRKASENIQNVV